jgi:hypothetical protein
MDRNTRRKFIVTVMEYDASIVHPTHYLDDIVHRKRVTHGFMPHVTTGRELHFQILQVEPSVREIGTRASVVVV